jgi:uncharacterized membrane protein YccC
MFANPAKAKHAAKVGLAMALAYGLALQWNWTNPYWAGMAVTFCSLTTTGESLNKSVLRIWGTLLGTLMAFFILGLFLQDRWLFLLAVCIHLSFVTYMMTGPKAQYMWQVTGFVSLIIMSGASGSSNEIFLYGMARMQETLLGVSVWALVVIFIWPETNIDALKSTATKLASAQQQLFAAACGQLSRQGSADSDYAAYAKLRAEQVGLLAKLAGELKAAGSESYAVRELRRVWQALLRDSQALLIAIDSWNAGFDELITIDMRQVVPDIDSRFDGIGRLLQGSERVDEGVVSTELDVEEQRMTGLTHFERAAVVVTLEHLSEIAAIAARLNAGIAMLKDSTVGTKRGDTVAVNSAIPATKMMTIDTDRLRSSIYIVAVTCVGFLLWVYVDTPGHQSLWSMAPTIGFVAAMLPHLRIGKALLEAFVLYLPVAGLIYLLVMPSLSSYLQLGCLIFAYVFWVQYKLGNFLAVTAGMLGLLNMMPITNHQSYSFVGIATGYLFILLCMLVVISCTYILGSPRPEKRFVALVRRYFRSAGYAQSFMAGDRVASLGLLSRYRMAFHVREIATLPKKMQVWSSQIDQQHYPDNRPDAVRELVAGLDALSYRVQELLALRDLPQAPYLVAELSDQVRDWRLIMQQGFGLIVQGESPGSAHELAGNLNKRLADIETSMDAALASTEGQRLNESQLKNAYQFLGAYRGVAKAAIAWVAKAEEVNWAQWHEESFS